MKFFYTHEVLEKGACYRLPSISGNTTKLHEDNVSNIA